MRAFEMVVAYRQAGFHFNQARAACFHHFRVRAPIPHEF
jgi:hypothetical protein